MSELLLRQSWLAGALVALWFGNSSHGAEHRPVPSASERWAEKAPASEPEFTRHVIPLLGKLGCNNRACHGSFQGQNGFRLSLFGHDPALDFAELTNDEGESRINLKHPEKSLTLTKPINGDEHGGGKRMDENSWQYRILRDWIAFGAKYDAEKSPQIEHVELTPAELRLVAPSVAAAQGQSVEQVPLRLRAYFNDGTFEDVTGMSIFSTNDDAVASVTEDGVISAVGPGDTAIVATYGGVVVTTHVIVPVPNSEPFPSFPPNNPIDEHVAAKLQKVGIHPSDLTTDSEFLRRVHVDLIGTLPTAEEAREFLADNSPDKRQKLIDRLLERPEYGMYWATRFSDWTGNDNRFTPQPREKTGWLWHDWLRDKLDRNVPYDELVAGLLTATTREGRTLDDTVEEYRTVKEKVEKGFDDGTYASRKTNDLFWRTAANRNPQGAALKVAYAFLGVRLECAQCHKHPFDRWTQDDFQQFSAFFVPLQRGTPSDIPEDLLKELTDRKNNNDYLYQELYVEYSPANLRTLKAKPPRLLGAGDVVVQEGVDPRVALMDWLRSSDNPLFAKAIVNRLWGHYFGVGIVEPVDDMNAANPPSNPQLLEYLAKDFIEHKFDLKHLHRRILNSRTYQLSWQPNDSNRLDERNFSHALLRRLPAEVVLDAINQVTGGQDNYGNRNAPPGTKTINLALSRLRGGGPEYALGIFGRPLRTQLCDCERSSETGLAQAMYLLNDVEVNEKIGSPRGALATLMKRNKDDRAVIEHLYLSTLARYPSDQELNESLAFVKDSESREAGLQDMLWSLINVREFIFNH